MIRMRNTRRILLLLVGVMIGVAIVLFILTNKNPVVLSFLYFETVPVWSSLLVLSSMAVGATLALIYTLWISMRYRSKLRRMKRYIRSVEGELTAFRNQPLDDPIPGSGDDPIENGIRDEIK